MPHTQADIDEAINTLSRKSMRDRKNLKRKREGKNRLLKKPWADMTFQERAKFNNTWKWVAQKRKWVRKKADEKKKLTDLTKRLKKQSKEMKKRAKRTGRRSRRHNYTPIAGVDDYVRMIINAMEFEDPGDIITTVFAKADKGKVEKDELKKLNKFYARPQLISKYIIKGNPVIVVVEDGGLYAFEGPKDIIKQIEKAFVMTKKKEGVDLIVHKKDM